MYVKNGTLNVIWSKILFKKTVEKIGRNSRTHRKYWILVHLLWLLIGEFTDKKQANLSHVICDAKNGLVNNKNKCAVRFTDLSKFKMLNMRNGDLILGLSQFFLWRLIQKWRDTDCNNQIQAALVIRELFNCELGFSHLQNSPKWQISSQKWTFYLQI